MLNYDNHTDLQNFNKKVQKFNKISYHFGHKLLKNDQHRDNIRNLEIQDEGLVLFVTVAAQPATRSRSYVTVCLAYQRVLSFHCSALIVVIFLDAIASPSCH